MQPLPEVFAHIKTMVTNLGMREGLILFSLFFAGMLYVGSRVSGWHDLAKHYPVRNRYEGKWISQPDFFGRDSGGLDIYFNNGASEDAIKLGADSEGLYLSMSIGFRFFHPPLFVPWSDVRSVWLQGVPWLKTKNLLRITFAQSPNVPLDVDRHVAGEIQKRSGGLWTMPEVE